MKLKDWFIDKNGDNLLGLGWNSWALFALAMGVIAFSGFYYDTN